MNFFANCGQDFCCFLAKLIDHPSACGRKSYGPFNFKILTKALPFPDLRNKLTFWHCIRAPPKRGRYWEIHPWLPRDLRRARLWISQCVRSFAGERKFSHHQSLLLLMTGEWYIPAVRQHWRLMSRGEGRVGGEGGRPEIASFSTSHISSQFQLPLPYLPTIFQGPQGLKARRGGPPKGKGRTLLRQDTCSCPGPSTIIGICQGFLTNRPK